MALGKNILTARLARGLKPQQLADMAGIDLQALRALEKRDSRTSEFTLKIADALGMSVEELLTGNSEKTEVNHSVQEPAAVYDIGLARARMLTAMFASLPEPQQRELLAHVQKQVDANREIIKDHELRQQKLVANT